jgi:hypothetical protein
MTPFQWITLPVLAVLFLTDVRLLLTRPTRRGFRLARALTWLAAGIAIFDPNLTTQAAHVIGIQRGADLVLYLFVLGTLAAAFSLYARSVRLERQVTELARHIALAEARRNPTLPTG